jgi:phage N-6-adenine-methyltransferase
MLTLRSTHPKTRKSIHQTGVQAMNDVLFSSAKLDGKDEWRTPLTVFQYFNNLYGPFDLDAAADESNHLCLRWFGPGGEKENALAANWGPMLQFNPSDESRFEYRPARVWLNPPYSETKKFLEKAVEELLASRAHTIALVAARTDTKVFHETIIPHANRIIFLKGRLNFTDPSGILGKNSAPFPSMVVQFTTARLQDGPLLETLSFGRK